MSKSERQAKLLQLIREADISTQEELVVAFNKIGLEVTQATISRDIKELGIIKVTSGHGLQKYVPMERSGEVASGRLMKVFSEAVVQVDLAVNLVIIKSLPGMAQACASALDSMRLPEVAGSIAGDDTVFVATRSAEQAVALSQTLSRIALQGLSGKNPPRD
ncbi:MAG: arginine repressor [Clostridiaceae bacterium]|jgi:transcriptional regulator of arginine metabolism|nr:arginine repressor [Clostridiaceae bacterium]